MPSPKTPPTPIDTSGPAPRKRSPEYTALGLYKRANALDEAIATLTLKLKEKRAEQVTLTEEVATHAADVQAIYFRLRPAPEKPKAAE